MNEVLIDSLTWKPPENYRQTESRVEGISVFEPIPPEEEKNIQRTYECPSCGAVTAYDVAIGGVACEHCGYQAPAKSQQVGLRAEQSEFTLEALQKEEIGWGVERPILHCDSCGAELSVIREAITTTCSFCGSNKVNIQVGVDDHIRPRFVVPFKIQPAQLQPRVKEWLGKGWFHPKSLASLVKVDRFQGIYLPFWVFNANIHSRWKAEVGYERQESHYNPSTKQMESRTVIDWRWESGDVDISPKNLLVTGTARVSQVILNRVCKYDLAALMTYTPDFLAGWQALSYDVGLQDSWEKGKVVMRDQAKDACHHDIPTSHVRNFSMDADFADESWRYILLPVYLSTYKYGSEGKIFQVMVNGQTGSVEGQKPVEWNTVWLVIFLILSPGLLLGLIGLPMILLGGVGVVPLVLGGILLIIGLIISAFIYKSAVDSEAA